MVERHTGSVRGRYPRRAGDKITRGGRSWGLQRTWAVSSVGPDVHAAEELIDAKFVPSPCSLPCESGLLLVVLFLVPPGCPHLSEHLLSSPIERPLLTPFSHSRGPARSAWERNDVMGQARVWGSARTSSAKMGKTGATQVGLG